MRFTDLSRWVRVSVCLTTAISLSLPSPAISQGISRPDENQRDHLRSTQVRDDPANNPTLTGLEEALHRAGQEPVISPKTPELAAPVKVAEPAKGSRTFWQSRGQETTSTRLIALPSPAGLEERNKIQGTLFWHEGTATWYLLPPKVIWHQYPAPLNTGSSIPMKDADRVETLLGLASSYLSPLSKEEERVAARQIIDELSFRQLLALLARYDSYGYAYAKKYPAFVEIGQMIRERLYNTTWEGLEGRLVRLIQLASKSDSPRTVRYKEAQKVLQSLNRAQLSELLVSLSLSYCI